MSSRELWSERKGIVYCTRSLKKKEGQGYVVKGATCLQRLSSLYLSL